MSYEKENEEVDAEYPTKAYQQNVSFITPLATSTLIENLEYSDAHYRNDLPMDVVDMSLLAKKKDLRKN